MVDKIKGKNKKIRNYVILILMFLAVILIVLYFCNIYKTYEEYQKETPVISGTLQEIHSEDLDHYVIDNPYAFIYMCVASSDECRLFEKDLKKLVRSKELSDDIIYLNLSNDNLDEFVLDFNKKYDYKVGLTTNYPAFVMFEDGKIINILQGNDKKKLTISKVKQFIELYEVGE